MQRAPLFITSDIRRFFEAVDTERTRQLQESGEQKHADGTGPDNGNARELAENYRDLNALTPGEKTWQTILLEKTYQALAEDDVTTLRAELVKVAAACAAWVRDIDTRPHSMICDHCGEAIPQSETSWTWHGPIPAPGQPNCATPRYHTGLEYPECRNR